MCMDVNGSDCTEFTFVDVSLKARVQGSVVSRTIALFAESYQAVHLTNGEGTQKGRPLPYVRKPRRDTTSSIGMMMPFFPWYMSPGNNLEGLREYLQVERRTCLRYSRHHARSQPRSCARSQPRSRTWRSQYRATGRGYLLVYSRTIRTTISIMYDKIVWYILKQWWKRCFMMYNQHLIHAYTN